MQDINIAAVRVHGERAGREDYFRRSHAVAWRGAATAYAWPYTRQGEEWLAASGDHVVIDDLGLPAEAWNDIGPEWRAAFRRGYIRAYHEDWHG
jgi:hypothetical protein